MNKQIESVQEFHEAFLQKNGKWPQHLSLEEYELRHKLMEEENDEYLEACDANDIVAIADALGDQLYILCGTILAHGMGDIIVNIFNEIHRSNMSKLDEDGNPIYREDGKIMKGPNYFKPNFKKILDIK